jgi:hypothetical protein
MTDQLEPTTALNAEEQVRQYQAQNPQPTVQPEQLAPDISNPAPQPNPPAPEPTTTPTTDTELQPNDKLVSILKDMKPEQVLKYQRDLSKQLGQDLFKGEIGKVFGQYAKPADELGNNLKDVVTQILATQPASATEPTTALNAEEQAKAQAKLEAEQQELYKNRVELELLRHGCPHEWLDHAITVAMAKTTTSDLSAAIEVAKTYKDITSQVAQPPYARTSAGIGDNKQTLTEAERVIKNLAAKNPGRYRTD